METTELQEFTPRPYQLDIYNQAVQHNSLIFLPTGSGKTFIAVLLIKRFSTDLLKPLEDGGKRAIFIVNTVPLVNQQSAYLARHTGLKCRGYSGSMEVDKWSEITWKQEISEYQILVMTSQIFVNLLNVGTIGMSQCSIIFFDECHRAVEGHPMRVIMTHFYGLSVKAQPRIIGMSATLINSNVNIKSIDDTLKTLEETFCAKIITVDQLSDVEPFSTSPKESVVLYEPMGKTELLKRIFEVIDDTTKILNGIQVQQNFDPSSPEFKQKNIKSRFLSVLFDIQEQFMELGVYGGDQAVLEHMRELNQIKRHSPTIAVAGACDYMISKLSVVRCLVHHELSQFVEHTRILNYSSNKVQNLIQLLKNFNEEKNEDQDFCCIVFVQRRFSAKVIADILQVLNYEMQEFKFLKADFIIGENAINLFKTTREDTGMAAWNRKVLHRFRNGVINCLVSTDLIDEGVDIPVCTIIIRFYYPQDYRAYVQSKGRARHSSSHFKVLIDNSRCQALLDKYCYYRRTEQYLRNTLVGQTNYRKVSDNPDKKQLCERYEVFDEETGITSYVDEYSAIGLLNKYCSKLFVSSEEKRSPAWTLKSSKTASVFQVSVKLPSISPLKKVVQGHVRSCIETAKRSAAFKTCIELHKIGELNNRLLPKSKDRLPPDLFKQLLPNWEDESLKEANPVRLHKLKYADSLHSAYPEENKTLYLHILHVESSRLKSKKSTELAVYDLLREKNGYAILSTKEMPMVPQFPIYMKCGVMWMDIQVNYKTLRLSGTDIEKLRLFHTMVFREIAPVIKQFMVFDKQHLENSFLVVPVDSHREIDFDLVENYKNFQSVDLKTCDTYDDLKFSLIEPKYRFHNTFYLVTNVRHDLSVWSPFPDREYKTYREYFQTKYEVTIDNLTQPLLEVKELNVKIDFHKPSERKEKESKLFLVPELCQKFLFPTSYFIKASILPTIIYRLSHLLTAETIRTRIAKDLGIGVIKLESGQKWQPFVSEETEDDTDDSSSYFSANSYSEAKIQEYSQNCNNSEIKDGAICLLNNHLNGFTFEEDDFNDNFEGAFKGYESVDVKREVPSLCLSAHNPQGVEPATLAKALTTAHADDIVNLERLETLGDAFLKFSTCLYLYEEYPDFNEAYLTRLKQEIVSNRNLFYCGKARSIPGMVLDKQFKNGIAPCYVACRELQEIILQNKISPNVLHEINVTLDESINGSIRPDRFLQIKENICKFDRDKNHLNNMEHYLSMQMVSDKTVSDAVEALIGAYLENCGVEDAVKVLQWFKILPRFNIRDVFYSVKTKPTIDPANHYNLITMATMVEKTLGYRFKNRAYLLEAMTHPTYFTTGSAKCYERLEFLGDSVIDFLITKHIYEKCGNRDPGELTDLRSALVNNVTFACLAVKYGFHSLMISFSDKLQGAIDKFVQYQERRRHSVNAKCLEILSEQDGSNISEFIDAPKVLGDLFESMIGAIYMDSGKSLLIVWEILYRLMHKEIEQFSLETPKQSVRVLMEMNKLQPRFSKACVVEGTEKINVNLTVLINNKSTNFSGFGANKKQARCAAAQHALEYIERLSKHA